MNKRTLFTLLLLLFTAGIGHGTLIARSAEKNTGEADFYWKNPEVRKGLYVAPAIPGDTSSPATLYLAGRKFCAAGTNCYELFNGSLARTDAGYRIDPAPAFAALDELRKQGVGVVRFNCGVYYAAEIAAYAEHRDEYIEALRQVAAYAQKLEIGLIPSLFWHHATLPDYFGEPFGAWGKADSRTVGFMQSYTREVVDALKGYKSIFAWEWGNEFNLQADLPNWQEMFRREDPANRIMGDDVIFAFRTFARTVGERDPDGRLLLSGNATLRPCQYHLYAEGSWDTDDEEQYRTIAGSFNPEPIRSVSEHVYEQGREFAGRGRVSLGEQVAAAMDAARRLGKVYVVGEYAGVLDSEREYRKYFDAFLDNGVQLTLIWNFSPSGLTEHSFTAGSERGECIFRLLREYNAKCRPDDMP